MKNTEKNNSTLQIEYSINLFETSFPMRANLPKNEPHWIKNWQDKEVYEKIRSKYKGKKQFILHDGPPYANGNIHLGHAANKILKDIIIKSKNFFGYDAPYIPGWDCHGMPIEIQIEKKFGKSLKTIEVIQKARKYASDQIINQNLDFQRLGILGEWKNPYTTMNFTNEADELRAFAKIVKMGYIFRALKPVRWCFNCASALSEAETDYKEKIDLSIYTIFPFLDYKKIIQIFNIPYFINLKGGIVIWTTMPWTIPSNQALSINPKLYYSLIETSCNKHIIIAEKQALNCLNKFNMSGNIISTVIGEKLYGLKFLHPLYKLNDYFNRNSSIYLSENVSADTGTGIVHLSPCYGIEDFILCKKYGLNDSEIIQTVMDNGKYINSLPIFNGLLIWEANKKIILELQNAKTLIYSEKYIHNYMYCWRHKTPIIYRATLQWFINMDFISANNNKTLREIAIEGIDKTKFYPSHNKKYFRSMIINRPDWTLSRQRQWGVPIAFFIHKKTGNLHPRTIEILEEIAKLLEVSGIEAWQNIDIKKIIGNEYDMYYKSNDTLDVWFDSGTTHWHVLKGSHPIKKHNNKYFQADLYLEGSDQYRGWFQSSLITSSILNNLPPYKAILSHGFVIDKSGNKVSKSLNNDIGLNNIIKKFGAEILRLWIASINYSDELSISDEILNRVSESYRRIRNTIRFLLANLSDFNYKIHKQSSTKLLEIDHYIIALTNDLQKNILTNYENYELYQIVAKIQIFCSEDMGGFYFDIIKDRLYTSGLNSILRRSAQTVLYYITNTLLRIIAPFLSFTAEEAWSVFNISKESIFMEKYYNLPKIYNASNIITKWNKLRNIRKKVIKSLEKARINKIIGSSLQAEIKIYSFGEEYILLSSLNDEIKFFFISSKVLLIKIDDANLKNIEVKSSEYLKCCRCWHYCKEVNPANTIHPMLCKRCMINLFSHGEYRRFV